MTRMMTVLFASMTVLVAGCITPYQPAGSTGGYSDQRIEENLYRVTFAGNGNTPREIVLKYFAYRCAELTLERGFEFFEIAGPSPNALVDGDYVPTRSAAPTFVYIPGGTYTVTRWTARAVIRMHRGDVILGSPDLYSAKEIVDLLAGEIRSGAPSTQVPEKLASLDRRLGGKRPSEAQPDVASPTAPPRETGGPVRLDDLKDLMKQ